MVAPSARGALPPWFPSAISDEKTVDMAGYGAVGALGGVIQAALPTLGPVHPPVLQPAVAPRACGCDCEYSDPTFLRGVCGPSLAIFLGIIEMVLRDRCDVAEPCRRAHAETFQRRGQDEFDYIVVGAGVAGSVVSRAVVRVRPANRCDRRVSE